MGIIVVTGANGFIGYNLVKYLLKQGYSVYGIDKKWDKYKSEELIQDNFRRLTKDIRELDAIPGLHPDAFIHLAWEGTSGEKRANYNTQINNAIAALHCLKLATLLGCKKIICAGSIMEFEANDVVYSQDMTLNPNYLYGIGKSLAHSICKAAASSMNIDFIWTYITNAFGPGENSPRFINTTLRKIINHEQLNFTSAVQNYDFIYIDDVVKSFELIIKNGKPNKNYLIGSGKARPLKEYIQEMCDTLQVTPNFGNVPYSGINTDLSVFDNSEFIKDCGNITYTSFTTGIIQTKQWLEGEIAHGK